MKRSVVLFAFVFAAAVPQPIVAQQMNPVLVTQPGNAVLTVSAHGETTRQPDLAVFNAGVTTQGKTAAEALAENSQAMTKVIAALKREGIAERDIQTSNLNINPIYSDPNRDAMMASRMRGEPYVPPPPEQQIAKIIGYQANNNVSVRQRRLEDYGKVIDTLVAAGANQVHGPSFQLDNSDAAMDEARIAAMKAARQRAQLYAQAAGLRVVRIISISEGGYSIPYPVAIQTTGAARGPAPPPPPPAPVQPGEMQVMANVTVLYELGL